MLEKVPKKRASLIEIVDELSHLGQENNFTKKSNEWINYIEAEIAQKELL